MSAASWRIPSSPYDYVFVNPTSGLCIGSEFMLNNDIVRTMAANMMGNLLYPVAGQFQNTK